MCIRDSICDSCAEQAYQIVKESVEAKKTSLGIDKTQLPDPKTIKEYLDGYIIGQENAKDVYKRQADSRTETYVAMKLFIDNWRWGGVPFYIRTGKRLPTRVSEVVIHFKPAPQKLFPESADMSCLLYTSRCV